MTARREFPAKIKVAAFERANGRCEECTAPLFPGKYHYDHVIADAMGGEPTLKNCAVLCLNCHGIKTATSDAPKLAKAKRNEARHIGARATPKAIIPGSKASPWKKLMDGTVVRRNP